MARREGPQGGAGPDGPEQPVGRVARGVGEVDGVGRDRRHSEAAGLSEEGPKPPPAALAPVVCELGVEAASTPQVGKARQERRV